MAGGWEFVMYQKKNKNKDMGEFEGRQHRLWHHSKSLSPCDNLCQKVANLQWEYTLGNHVPPLLSAVTSYDHDLDIGWKSVNTAAALSEV